MPRMVNGAAATVGLWEPATVQVL